MIFEKTYGIMDPARLAKWFTHKDGGQFLIAPMNNTKQLEENLKLMNVGDTEVDQGSYYDAKVTSCDIMAKSVLLDWKEVSNEDGTELKYTAEVGSVTLYKYDDFREWVGEQADSLVEKAKEKEEAVTKK